MLQREYSSPKSSSSMLLCSGFATARLGSPSGIPQRCRGAGWMLDVGEVPCEVKLPANPTFPITIPLQTLFPDLPHPLPALTIPHLCPISKEPCPGDADASDPLFRGRLRCCRTGSGPRTGGVAHASQEPGVHCGACSASLRPRGSPSAPTPPLSRGVTPLEPNISASAWRKDGRGWDEDLSSSISAMGTGRARSCCCT